MLWRAAALTPAAIRSWMIRSLYVMCWFLSVWHEKRASIDGAQTVCAVLGLSCSGLRLVMNMKDWRKRQVIVPTSVSRLSPALGPVFTRQRFVHESQRQNAAVAKTGRVGMRAAARRHSSSSVRGHLVGARLGEG